MQERLCCIIFLLVLWQSVSSFSIIAQQPGMRRKNTSRHRFFKDLSKESSGFEGLETIAVGDVGDLMSANSENSGRVTKREQFFKVFSGDASVSHDSAKDDGDHREGVAANSGNIGRLTTGRRIFKRVSEDAVACHGPPEDHGVHCEVVAANSQVRSGKRKLLHQPASDHTSECHDPNNSDADLDQVLADVVRKTNRESMEEGIELQQATEIFGKRRCLPRSAIEASDHVGEFIPAHSQGRRVKRKLIFESESDGSTESRDPENSDADLHQVLADLVKKSNSACIGKGFSKRRHLSESVGQSDHSEEVISVHASSRNRQRFFLSTPDVDPESTDGDLDQILADMVREMNHRTINDARQELHETEHVSQNCSTLHRWLARDDN